MAIASLSGRKCVITGASRGIGAAIARRLAAEGAICTLIGRNSATLSDVLASLQPPSGHVHSIRQGNIAERSFWEGLVRETEMKDVDLLVNAAGITHYSLLATTKAELLEDVLQTNLMGTMWACKSVVKTMMRRKQGCIINVASLLGLKGGKGSIGYAASKAGVIGLTRSLAAEVGSLNIRVNAIVPGYIETQMTTAMTPDARSQALSAIPLNRFGQAEEIADAAVFLARNEYASNCILNIDGGLSAM